MIVRWRGDRALADREAVAELYGVSAMTVRRWCQPVDYDGPTGRALYDVVACETTLADITPRPQRTTLARRRAAVLARQRAHGGRRQS